MMRSDDGQEPAPPQEAVREEPRKPAVKPFNLQGVHPSVAEAYNALKSWLTAINHGCIPPFSLTLCGRSGCGKTHLLQNAVAYLNARAFTCASYSWPSLLQKIKDDEPRALASLRSFKALAVDNIGAENTSGKYIRGTSSELLDRLVELRLGKWTLYATNCNMKGIENIYTPRIASRLIRNGGRVVDMSAAQDYSLINPKS